MYRIAAGIMLLAFGVAGLSVGVAFGAYAIYMTFLPRVGEALAAGITASVFLILPLIVYMVLAARARERARQATVLNVLSMGLGLINTYLSKRR